MGETLPPRPIIDSSRLLAVSPETIPEFKDGKEIVAKGMEYVICAIDIGSTNPKVEVWNYNPKTKTFNKKDVHIEWGDYKTQVETISHTRMKFLDNDHTQILLSLIKKQVEEALAGEEFGENKQLVFATTGFHHDLCITNRKSGESAVILDDPSAHPSLSREERDALKQQLAKINKDFETFVDNPTSLAKILWLTQHPEALKRLFNTEESIDFDQFDFSMLRSLIASKVLENKRQVISSIEKTDFGLPTGEEFPEIAIWLTTIGIEPYQFLFAQDQLIAGNTKEHGPTLLYDQKDLTAELKIISWAMDAEIIDETGTAICADSVGKIICRTKTCPENGAHDKDSETSYETQRMLANINRDWMGPLTLNPGETMNRDAYENIDLIIKEMMAAGTKTPYVYMPTEKGKGIVYKLENEQYLEQPRKEILTWTEEEKKLVMLAVAKGAFFGIRQKMEHIRKINSANLEAPVYFYGGLLGHTKVLGGKDGWQQICIGAMPQGAEVYEIGLPSGATAVAFSALTRLLSKEDNEVWQKKFSIEVARVGTGGTLQAEYQAWAEAQAKMIEQDLLIMKKNCKMVKKV